MRKPGALDCASEPEAGLIETGSDPDRSRATSGLLLEFVWLSVESSRHARPDVDGGDFSVIQVDWFMFMCTNKSR
jgi:hypothetical protein